jgi:hypothetical protein
MQDPDSLDKGESNVEKAKPEETKPPENPDLSEPGPSFEEQEGEFVPPEEQKKSGTGKALFLLILVLAGSSSSYLYYNDLIPSEILNLIAPKSAPSKPPAVVTQSPPFIEEEPVEIPSAPEPAEPIEVLPAPPQDTHLSGAVNEPMTPPHISGGDFDQTEVEEPQETTSPEESESAEEPAAVVEPAPMVVEQEETVGEEVTAMPPSSTEPEEPERSKAAQAYLDFIEASVQKLGKLIKEGFNLAWDYMKNKIS